MEEYHKEMELTMIWAQVQECPKTTMAPFLEGLTEEIANILEL